MANWLCRQCNTLNSSEKPRCGFCSNPRSIINEKKIVEQDVDQSLKPQLHSIVERLTPLQQKKLFRYFEDNIL